MNTIPNSIIQYDEKEDDYRRYTYLCSLARMFSAGNRFTYSIQRKDRIVEIHLLSPDGKQENAIFNFDDPECRKAEEIRKIISLIVNFVA